MHEVLVNRIGGLSLPRKSVVRLTDRPDMTLDVYRGRKTTMQQQQQILKTDRFLTVKYLSSMNNYVLYLGHQLMSIESYSCMWGWSGGAKVLDNLPGPGCPTNLDYSRARACCACNR